MVVNIPCQQELRILRVAKARLAKQTIYYSGLERGIGDLKARSPGVKTELAGQSVERLYSVFVLLLNILTEE
jgi:hypothetical protein